METTQTSLFRFLCGMLHDEEAASDLFQETYVKAFQGLGSFRGEATPTTWLLGIARNLTLNRLRRRRLEARWQVATDELPEVADDAPDALAHVSETRLRHAVAALPPSQREAVVLFYLEDLPVDEVARLTGRPANTVKSDLRRARHALEITLTDPGAAAARPGGER